MDQKKNSSRKPTTCPRCEHEFDGLVTEESPEGILVCPECGQKIKKEPTRQKGIKSFKIDLSDF